MPSPRKIAVAGATGRVGHHVADVLIARGYDVVPMSRSHGVDVITGEGLPEALAGVVCVIDAATGPSPDQQEATDFFSARVVLGCYVNNVLYEFDYASICVKK